MAQAYETQGLRDETESTPLLGGNRTQSTSTPFAKPAAAPGTTLPKSSIPLMPKDSNHRERLQHCCSQKPNLVRAVTTAAVLRASAPCSGTATPILSRPLLNRASSATSIPQDTYKTGEPPTTARPGRPSLIRGATDILGLNANTSLTYRSAPTQPSHWTDHAHRKPLLQAWELIHNAAATRQSKYVTSITAQLVTTEKQMLQEFAELNEGDVLLTREWIEFVRKCWLAGELGALVRLLKAEEAMQMDVTIWNRRKL
ncbi:hypothetical protein LTR78_002034 [Recurvomyces mirabilis]|uniref:Uncharacterized protein n=1 Tax=Recurvomyces mirabilis TaxID=574656 RepID=A0AAE0WTL1_9PEZI|nr:hypothetical protein LTR78_002034 [Recurvomyces mirabilis]KAK5160492.1 hypothetical protein LTS14_001504 [Recurvomyces mirabilis]